MDEIIHSPMGAVHVAAAVLALVVGPIVFFRAKGDGAHRTLGWIYLASMIVVSLAGLPIRSFGGISPFHVLAIVSLSTIAAGLIAVLVGARRREGRDGLIHAHMKFMTYSYTGLVAAGLAQVVSRVMVEYGQTGPIIGIGILLTVAVCMAITILLIRFVLPDLAARYFPSAP
jgi:uncharacterized membrane protein